MEKSNMELLNTLNNDPDIRVNANGNISSFNFTRKAFYDQKWNERTMTARGLFMNTETGDVVCRGYNKFFELNEREETSLPVLYEKLKFPVEVFVKENGFLGMSTYYNGGLYFATKSSSDNIMCDIFKETFYTTIEKENVAKIKEFLKNNPVTLVFECIEPDLDPHIIDYKDRKLFLLDAVKNEIKFSTLSYDKITELANNTGLSVKQKVATINTKDEFSAWIRDVSDKEVNGGYKINGNPIEGFVLRDANDFMVKIKTHYYKFWKRMRSNIHKKHVGEMTPLEKDFYDFAMLKKEFLGEKDFSNLDIITLRKEYEKRQQ